MKKILFISFTALAATFASCGDMLNQPPKSEIGAEYFYTNADEVNTAILGCYNGLQAVMTNEWSVTELRTPNARMYANNSTSQNNKLIEQLDQGVISTSSDFITNYWDACYTTISRCNDVLVNLGVVTDAAQKAQFEGEAKFLRAHIYFNLVRLWGPMFLVDRPLSSAEARYKQRSSVDEIYALIEGDLEKIVSEDMLPVSYPATSTGRATKLAAEAILAKVYMTHYAVNDPKYARAEALLKDVITKGGNPAGGSAMEPFAKIFDITNEMNKEIIFTVRYLSGGKGLGSAFGNMFAPGTSGSNVINGDGSSYNYPSDDIINTFKANASDIRKDITLAENYVNKTNGNVITVAPCRYTKKYLAPVDTRNDGESDWPIVRMGDVTLLYAEILNELYGPTADAFKYLNMTRTRAGLTALTAVDCPDKLALRDAIRKERRLELSFENHYWFDLMRWGIAVQTVNDYLAAEAFYQAYSYTVNPITANQVLLPIPQKVININPDIAQNPGY